MVDLDKNDVLRISIRDRVLNRASTDPEFRRLMMDNPKSAIARELGIDVPDNVHVTVIPEGPNQLFVVLPNIQDSSETLVATGIERLAVSDGGHPSYGI